MPELEPLIWAFAVAIAVFAGIVKGAVGFAMPMILISGLGSVLAPEAALAALILPTVASNLLQAGRSGFGAAWRAVKAHRVYLGIVLVTIALSAQLVRVLPDGAMFLLIGVPITLFSLTQLVGFRFRVHPDRRRTAEVSIAGFAGFVGGISGTWGPPTVVYLTALDTPKKEAVQIQGVIYGLGSLVLLGAHINSGVLTPERSVLSALLCVPAGIGMLVGFKLQDRMNQERFRRATLVVLILAGANLIRRGLVG